MFELYYSLQSHYNKYCLIFQILCPSILVAGHFAILKLKGREPTREDVLKRHAEEYMTYLEEQNLIAMSVPATTSTLTILYSFHLIILLKLHLLILPFQMFLKYF